MARDDIRKLIDESKRALGEEREAFAKTVRDDLESFKRRTLERI